MNKIIKTKSEAETRAAAVKLAKTLKGGDIVALIGDLGAGKTVWVKGMAEGIGIQERVLSPTFVLLRCHEIKRSGIRNKELGIKQLCHVDAYRLKDALALESIGINDYLGAPDTITVIEWADRVEKLLAGKKVLKIEFGFGKKEKERIIKISNV